MNSTTSTTPTTKQDLSLLTTSELQTLLRQKQDEAQRWSTKQMALKISLNSCYGSFGNNYFRHFDIRIAESITLSGQLAIRFIQNQLNKFLNSLVLKDGESEIDFVVASDTDSVILNLSKIVDKKNFPPDTPKESIVNFLSDFCKKMEPIIFKFFQELADYMNAYQQKMVMQREIISDRAFWTAKKRYAANVWDSEGTRFSTPQLKIMGLETQRSSTPKICRDNLKEAIRLILTEDRSSVLAFIDSVKQRYFKVSSAGELAFPSGINGLDEYEAKARYQGLPFAKATPIHVKAALSYNRLLDDMKLTKKYVKIKNGDKIKYVYLVTPSPVANNAIAFIGDTLPPEFGLEEYIDYGKMFEKTFRDPLKSIMHAIGWDINNKETLSSIFQDLN